VRGWVVGGLRREGGGGHGVLEGQGRCSLTQHVCYEAVQRPVGCLLVTCFSRSFCGSGSLFAVLVLRLLAGQLRVSPHALPPEWGAVLLLRHCWYIARGNATERARRLQAPRRLPPSAACVSAPRRAWRGSGGGDRLPVAQHADSIALGSAVGALTLWVLPSSPHLPSGSMISTSICSVSLCVHHRFHTLVRPTCACGRAHRLACTLLLACCRHARREPLCRFGGHHHLCQGLRLLPGCASAAA
jgi:hypothetical protein